MNKNIQVCDVCKKETEGYNNNWKLSYKASSYKASKDIYYDICPGCVASKLHLSTNND